MFFVLFQCLSSQESVLQIPTKCGKAVSPQKIKNLHVFVCIKLVCWLGYLLYQRIWSCFWEFYLLLYPVNLYLIFEPFPGANVRIDTTLLGFDNMNWLRGSRSFVFKGQGETWNLLLDLSRNNFFCCHPSQYPKSLA